ncbi:ankyrin repeat-containing domain protein [Gorgonomyces haynaldii]|nr:ankyrin repeat-containing domain protein [Gorgonomyces haynaldii]
MIPLEIRIEIAHFLDIDTLFAIVQTNRTWRQLLNLKRTIIKLVCSKLDHPSLAKSLWSQQYKASVLLVKSGYDLGDVYLGQSPLMFACRQGSQSFAVQLMESSDIHMVDASGQTALFKAVLGNRMELISQLLHRGADINVLDKSGATALFLSCGSRNLSLCQLLLDSGADPNLGNSCLSRAVDNGDVILSQLLLQYGSKAIHDPSLFSACLQGNASLVKLLLDAGAEQTTSDRGWTPLHNAVRSRNLDVCKMLVEKGAAVDAQDSCGIAPLSLCHDTQIAQFLVESGARINLVTKSGATALYRACSSGNYTLAHYLLEKGADPNIAARNQTTALMMAQKRCPRLARLLVSYGAK